MTEALKTELAPLEAEFAALDKSVRICQDAHIHLSGLAAPIQEQIRENEANWDRIKTRHAELGAKLAHLRKAVGQ
jgi:chromosome segregation ATPase